MDDKDIRKDLGDQLEELFSEIIPEPEVEIRTGEDKSLLEKAVVASLLEGKAMAAPVAAARALVEAPPPIPIQPEEVKEGRKTPPASIPSWGASLGKQRFKVLNILLSGVVILGGVPVAILMIHLISQKQVIWSGFQTLYCAAYTVAVAITLTQWLFNSSLTRVLRETEKKHTEAVRSQTLLERQVEELAMANALLQRRALQFQTAAQVSNAVTSVLDPDELVQRAVDLICGQFDLYYTGLFLIDESGQWAVLRAGTGKAGHQMLAQGCKLETNRNSVVGRCIADAQARIALDVAPVQAAVDRCGRPQLVAGPSFTKAPAGPGEEIVELAKVNPLLPETRSQMVLPLRVDRCGRPRGWVIGALDIHSTKREALSKEDIPALQMVADQVAVAIDNAYLFAESQATLETARRAYGECRPQRSASSKSWAESPRTRPTPGCRSDERGISGTSDKSAAIKVKAKQSLAVPIAVYGDVIGVLDT